MHNYPDLVNGSFEMFGAFATLVNVLKIAKDKKTRGVNGGSMMFFLSWGIWNLYYYPHLDQWASFTGGLIMTTLNLIWLLLWWKYRKN